MTDSPILRRTLAAIAACCMVIGSGIALAKGEDDDYRLQTWQGRAGSQGDMQQVDGFAEAPPPPDRFAGQMPVSGLAWERAVLPRPGMYVYVEKVTGSDERTTRMTNVRHVGTRGDDTIVALEVTRSQGTTTHEMHWGQSVITTRKTSLMGERGPTWCDWTPDLVHMTFPLRPGATWSSQSTCQADGAEFTGTYKHSVAATVVASEVLTVEGRQVATWRIRATEHQEVVPASGEGRTSDVEVVRWFSPIHGLNVKTVSTVTSNGTATETTSEILSLDPQ